LLAAEPAQSLPAQSFPRELHEVYNLNPDGTVTVSNSSGYIRITTWNENRVQVDAVKNARREEDWPLVEIRVVSQPSRLETTRIIAAPTKAPGGYGDSPSTGSSHS